MAVAALLQPLMPLVIHMRTSQAMLMFQSCVADLQSNLSGGSSALSHQSSLPQGALTEPMETDATQPPLGPTSPQSSPSHAAAAEASAANHLPSQAPAAAPVTQQVVLIFWH